MNDLRDRFIGPELTSDQAGAIATIAATLGPVKVAQVGKDHVVAAGSTGLFYVLPDGSILDEEPT